MGGVEAGAWWFVEIHEGIVWRGEIGSALNLLSFSLCFSLFALRAPAGSAFARPTADKRVAQAKPKRNEDAPTERFGGAPGSVSQRKYRCSITVSQRRIARAQREMQNANHARVLSIPSLGRYM
jgi:hypothetical protein